MIMILAAMTMMTQWSLHLLSHRKKAGTPILGHGAGRRVCNQPYKLHCYILSSVQCAVQ
jgi:hypothetical protein